MSEEQKPTLFKRIWAIMAEVDYIQKGDAKVNSQYKFVSHDAVMAKLHPMLVKHGVLVIPTVAEMTQEGNRTRVKLIVTFCNADDKTEFFSVEYYGYGVDQSDKGPGKAISYALKYALLKVFALETGEDPDNDQTSSYEPAKCLEFDATTYMGLSDSDKKRMERFLKYSASILGKHIEDVKREAIKRPEDFMKAFAGWKPS